MAFWAVMTVQSAVDLYGMPSTEVTAVADALDSVGLGGTAAQPSRFAPLAAALGSVADTTIRLRNLSSQPMEILTAATTRSEFSLAGPLPVTLAFGDTAAYQLSFDATGLTSTCDLGQHEDTLVFTTSSASYPTITVPITVSLGHVAAAPATSAFATDCATLTAGNDPSLGAFVGGGVDALYKGSLLIGLVNGSDTTVYWNLYETSNYATVDNFATGSDPQGRQTETVRIATGDGRLQGSITYTYHPTGGADCESYLVDYTLHNDCDTALTIITGVFSDFDILSYSSNRAFADAPRDLVYMRDAADSWAVGWTLLSGSALNRRAINNPAWIYPGFSQAEAYFNMASTLDLNSTTGDDWSVLLTFGETLLLPGDTVAHQAALTYSDAGTAGLRATVDALRAGICQIEVSGDVDLSTDITAADIIWLVNHVFKSGLDPLPCAANGDVDCSGAVTAADIIFEVNHVFKGGPPPCDICGMVPGIWTCP
jgi:hypothetical protein